MTPADFAPGDRVRIHTPHDLAWNGKTGTVHAGLPPEPPSDYGYDAWVMPDDNRWGGGPYGFTRDELQPEAAS